MKGATAASIELHVDELVLHGFAPGDRYRIARALERELGRLLATQTDPQRFAEHAGAARIEAGAFAMTPGTTPETAGAQVARAVFGSIGR